MAQSSENKLNKRFDQNIEVTGTIKIGVREQTTTGDYVSNKLILIPPYHTGGPFNIRTRDDAASAFISIAYGSNEVATIKHDGTIKIGSNTVVHSGNISSYALTSFDITSQTDPKYLRSNADDTTTGNITISKNAPYIYLYDTNQSSTNHPELRFNTANNQGVKLVHNEFDTELPIAGYGLILTGDNANTQFGTTGTLSFVVHGNIYAGGTTNSTVSRVLTTADEGSGNGLDADTLDGLHASSFLTSVPSEYLTQTEGDARYLQSLPSHTHTILKEAGSISYGTPGLQWFDLDGTGGAGTNNSTPANPFSDWHHHLIMNHNNSAGYYVDMAYSFHNDRVHFRRNAGNSFGSWREFIHSGNIGSQSVSYATNAGTLDGIDSSSFLRSDANDTMNGTLTMNSTLLMNNYNIEGVNHLKFNDSGAGEGIEWVGGNGWKIYESGNNLDNTSGNLQFVTGSTRRMTLNTSGILEVFGSSLEINGKYARDFAHSRYISGGGSLYGSGTSGWTTAAKITVTGNCSGAVLYGKMFSRAYHEAEIYNIAVVIRAECDFTSNNESHFIEFGCTTAASSENTDYRNRIRAVLVESSTNRRTYEVQFFETAWNDNWWELWTSGFTIYETPQTPGTATGTARINYRSRLGADDLYVRNGAYAPTFYDKDNTSYYTNPASTSNLNAIDADHLNLGGASGDDGEDLKVGGIRGRFTNELIHLYNRVNIGYPSGWAGQDAPNYGISTYGSADLATNAGYTTSGGSMRAPIFYDSDNTNYYTNPASTSTVNVVNFAGYSSANGGFQVARNIGTTSPSWQDANHTLSLENSDAGYLSINFHRAGYTSNNIYYTGTEIITDDTFRSTVDMRAPIFYDSNDTAYYVNPNSSSNLQKVTIVGTANGNDPTLRVTSTTSNTYNHAIECFNSNLTTGEKNIVLFGRTGNDRNSGYIGYHWEGASNNNNYVTIGHWNYDNLFRVYPDQVISTNQISAPIFYDYNNTGYYVDPASTSILERLYIYEGTNGAGAQIRFSDHASGSYAQNGVIEYVHADTQSYGSGNAFKFYGTESSMSFHVAGQGLFTGDIVAYYSDMRLKTKLGDIENPIGKIKALNGFYYEPNEKALEYGYEKERRIGLSAQEVQEVVPEAVTMAAIGDNYLSVDYAKLVPVLVEAIKELSNKVEELENKLNGTEL